MFQKMLEWIRQTMDRIFQKPGGNSPTVDIAVSTKMQSAITKWADMYNNDRVLELPAAIASEFARLTTIEMQSEVTGSPRADYLNTPYQKVLTDIRRMVEYGCAKGGLIFKPYVSGDKIVVDYIQADSFYPTAFDTSGRMTGVIFADQLKRRKKIYTLLESYNLTEKGLEIINKAFVSGTGTNLGREIDLTDVPEWAGLTPEITIAGVDRPLFGYFKPPQANTIDTHSPLGVSVYSRATGLIKDANEQYLRLKWEFEGSELAIDAADDALKPHEGQPSELPKRCERLFRRLDASDTDFYHVFSPTIRDQSLINGLNKIFQRIEFGCGLAYGTISDPQNVDKTAEEIKASKQRSYAAVSDTQKSLKSALEDLVYSIDTLTTLYHLAPEGKYEATFDFDDSILVDKDTEKQLCWQYVISGKFPAWRYFVKYEGMTEEDAKSAVEEAQSSIPKMFPGEEA